MNDLFVEFRSLVEHRALFADFEINLARETNKEFDEQGDYFVGKLKKKTVDKGLVGATKKYLHSHQYEHSKPVGAIAGIRVFNSSPHAEFAERGRSAGSLGGEDADESLKAWMRAKGIPLEAFQAIKWSIIRNGTIKRFDGDGGRVYEETYNEESDKIMAAMSEVLGLVI